jgi:hypothetical protein
LIDKEIDRLLYGPKKSAKVTFPKGDPKRNQLSQLNKQLNNLRLEKEILTLDHTKTNASA